MPEVNVKLKRRRLEVQIINLEANIARQELEILELEDQIEQKRINIEATRHAIADIEKELAQFPKEKSDG